MAFLDKNSIVNHDEEVVLDDNFVSENKKNVRVVFMGTPSFAVPILEGLIQNYQVVLVVCQPDRKKDRKGNMIVPDTKVVAVHNQIEVFQPVSIREDYNKIIDAHPDIIITCAYGQIIPNAILKYPKYGCINVHGSLLPELRGGAPIHWAIIRGLKETGITIMSMSSKMDAGDIICKSSLDIGSDEILDSLYKRMSYLGRDLLLETLPSILDGTCTYLKQDETLATFGYNVTKEDEKIDFSRNGNDIRNLVRGLNSIPGAYCYLDGKRMKIYDVEVLQVNNKYSNNHYGEIVDTDCDGIICKCGDGLLKIKEIAIEGKKRCLVRDYFNGIKKESLIGKVLL